MDAADLKQPEDFRHAMAHLAGAVSVVTVGSDEDRNGLTVTSTISVSLVPPVLLFCINRTSSSWPLLQRDRCFAVNVLGARHKRLADQFAGRTGHSGPQRYEGGLWRTLQTGAPILIDALVAFDCDVDQTICKYSHEIVVGQIRAISRPNVDDRPLVYWRRSYEDIFRPGCSLQSGERSRLASADESSDVHSANPETNGEKSSSVQRPLSPSIGTGRLLRSNDIVSCEG